MYELIRISENDYYFECFSKVGLVKINEKDAVLIDGGCEKDLGEKIYQTLIENGLTLKAIYNTHAHADHVSANKYLKEKTGCKVYVYGAQRWYTEYPIFLTVNIYGTVPVEELQNDFLMTTPCAAEPLTEDLLPKGFEIIDLSGHMPDMVGIKTANGNLFIGDSLVSEKILKKCGVSFAFDIEKYIETIKKLKTLKVNKFIPSHAEVCSDISPLADINLSALAETEQIILKNLKEPKIFEDLLKDIFDAYSLSMTVQQYALVGSTVRSFLTMLKKQNRVEIFFKDNKMYWKTV